MVFVSRVLGFWSFRVLGYWNFRVLWGSGLTVLWTVFGVGRLNTEDGAATEQNMDPEHECLVERRFCRPSQCCSSWPLQRLWQ